mgnify:CR=1 FL=1
MKKLFKKMLSRDDVNTGRQIEIDIAKAVCIIFMIVCHAFEQIPNIEGSAGVFEFIEMRIFNTLLGATLFMFCMGIGLAYSRNNDPKKIILRGATLLLIAFALSFIRLPFFAMIINAIFPGSIPWIDIIIEMLANDILYFAGLAMMLFGLLKLLKFKWWGILIVGFALSIAGNFLNNIEIPNNIGNALVGWFIGTKTTMLEGYITTSYFPLFNWFIMVASGYSFGCLYKKVQDKKLFFLVFGIISALLVGAYIGICLPNKYLFFQEDFICTYHITTIDAIASMFAAVTVFAVYYALSFILPKFLLSGASHLSRYINTVYCIQWFFYGNATIIYMVFFPDVVHGPWIIILWAIIVAIISITLGWLYKTVLPRYIKKRKEAKAA